MNRFSKLIGFIVVFIAVMAVFSTISFAAEQQYTGNLIPIMTSDTSNGIASSSSVSNAGFPTWKAFDHNTSDRNGWGSNFTHPNWLAYEFTKPQIITKYTLCTNYVDTYEYMFPKNWTFEAWDGTQWNILDTRNNITNWTNNVKKEFYFTNVTAYKKYRLNVSSNIYGTSGTSVVISEMEMMASIVTAPSAPSNLQAAPGNEKVDLSWDTVAGATSYNVKRSETPGGPYQTFATTTAGAITYSDIGLINGKSYYYVVSAVNTGGESPNSNEVSATPQAINQLKLVLEVREEKQLSVSDELSDNAEMDWTSFNTTIAAIDVNGRIKALKPGNTIITCTSKDKSYTKSINVLVVDLEYQLAVDLTVGGNCRLTIDDLKNTTNVTWSSYDPTIASVSTKGKVNAVSEGLTYILAADIDGKEVGRIYIRVR